MGYRELTPLANVKVAHRAVMANNEFSAIFKEVEIDNDYNLDNFYDAEIDFDEMNVKLNLKQFNLYEKGFALRIRKIRGSRAGSYYPSHKTIVLHPRYMDSFVHELGHLLDYNCLPKMEKTWNGRTRYVNQMLSEQENFKAIHEAYIENFKAVGGKATHDGKYSIKYYTNNKEVFARLLEAYYLRKFGETKLVEQEVGMRAKWRAGQYPLDNEELMVMTDNYFNTLFYGNQE
jgi:hypothetical protein